jgi:formylglycine-generating enzyme required for sulfatase activity
VLRNFSFCLVLLFCLSKAAAQPAMTAIPAGTFFMGSNAGDEDEKPVRQVKIERFFLANTETTYSDFKAFVTATNYQTDAERGDGSYVWDSLGWHKQEGVNWRHDERGRLREKGPELPEKYPVVHVSFEDAARYCNWLSKIENLTEMYVFDANGNCQLMEQGAKNGYRLPFEKEWEYAAKTAGQSCQTAYAGDQQLGKVGWYSGNSEHKTWLVAKKKPVLGNIYDLSGNVWEWCHDLYDRHQNKNCAIDANSTPKTTGNERSIRGGSWNNNKAHCRISNRSSRAADFRDGSLGFRVARWE